MQCFPETLRKVLSCWWLRIALGLSVCVVMSQGALAQAPLVFLGDRDLPPYEFLENGKPRGANVEIAMAVGRVLGRPTEVRLTDWSKAPEILLSGQADALTLLGRTAEREKLFRFSAPTVPVSFALFVRADEAVPLAGASLAQRRIGVTAGGLARTQMESLHPEATLVWSTAWCVECRCSRGANSTASPRRNGARITS